MERLMTPLNRLYLLPTVGALSLIPILTCAYVLINGAGKNKLAAVICLVASAVCWILASILMVCCKEDDSFSGPRITP